KGPVRKKELLPVAVAAWCEAFGTAPPGEEDRQATRDQARAEFLQLLKKGKKGIEQWNADSGRLAKAGNFHGVDLSGLDLTGIDSHTLDFGGANFTGAKLNHAQASHYAAPCKFPRACFREAELREAYMTRDDFTDADFTGAVLTEAKVW